MQESESKAHGFTNFTLAFSANTLRSTEGYLKMS